MKKIIKAIYAILLSVFWLPIAAFAQSASSAGSHAGLLDRLNRVAGQGGFQTDGSATLPIIIGTIISAFLGFLGVIFIVLMIMAGFTWMNARGNEEEIKKSKNTLREALVGLIIAMSSYAVWNYIFNNIINTR